MTDKNKTYSDNEALDRIKFLSKELLRWNDLYRDGNPEVTDEEYDATFAELENLETLWPDFAQVNSPTTAIKQRTDVERSLIEHVSPMLSLETMIDFSNAPLLAFMERVAAIDPDALIVREFKYDGIALELRYESGVFKHAVTRGDGRVGEDITKNLERLSKIPRLIDPRITRVRGELLIDNVDFDTINSMCEIEGTRLYSNSRNAAAGIARAGASQYVEYLGFYPYEVFGEDMPDSYLDRIALFNMYCSEEKVNRTIFGATQTTLATNDRDAQTELSNDALIPRDGLVYKVDSEKIRNKMGMNTQWPNWAYAHKFRPQSATARLNQIVLTVGRTGKIAPTGKVSLVTIGGVMIDSVFLHNEERIISKDLRIGDLIVLERAGDVIPYVRGLAIPVDSNRSEAWKMPPECPCCGKPIRKEKRGDEETADYYCHAGFDCKDQALGLFEYACSRAILDIRGLGEAIIEKLYRYSGLGGNPEFRQIQHIFLLDEEIITAAGVSPLVAKKIVQEIEEAKTTDLWRAIAALGIRLVGAGSAKELAKHCHTVTDLLTLNRESLLAIEDVGEATADNIMEFISKESNQKMLRELAELTAFKAPVVNVRNGLTVCVSGSFDIDRNALKEKLENEGYRVVSGISKKLDLLVVGELGISQKADKARKLGVEVIEDPTASLEWHKDFIAKKAAK